MDEETIEMPLTPQIIESNSNPRRNLLTPEVTEAKDGSLKLSSTGKTRSSVSGEKVIPHYLRASTGSCHDSCKYGGHHSFEGKAKGPIWKGKRIPSSYDGQDPIVTVSIPQIRKKKPSVKLISSDPGIKSCDTPEINQHAFVVEEDHPTPKGKKATSSESLPRRKNKPSTILPSSDPTTKNRNTLETTKQAFEVKEKNSVPSRTKTTSLEGQHMVVSRLQRRSKKPSVKLTSPDSTTKSQDTVETTEECFEMKGNYSMLKSTKSTSFQGKNTTARGLPTREKMSSAKRTSSDSGSRGHVTPVINQHEAKIINQKVLSSAKKVANVAKYSVAFKPRRSREKIPSLLNLPKDQTVRRDSVAKTGTTTDTLKVDQKKDRALQKAISYPQPSLNRIASLNTKRNLASEGASPLTNENKTKLDGLKLPVDENLSENSTKLDEFKLPVDENDDEKILHVPGSKNLELDLNACVSIPSTASSSLPSTSSSPPSLSLHAEEYIESEYSGTETESEYDDFETDSEYDETKDQDQLGKTSNGHRRSRRAATVTPEDDDPGHKLKFRRGRVLDLQSVNNTPRRLRFKKGKVLGDDRNGDDAIRRKNLRKMEGTNPPDTADVHESEKVVLRHKDVDGKRDAQGLFNNVIEETASKLAETRKSKVKALVGAFETVISLQDSKPSATGHL